MRMSNPFSQNLIVGIMEQEVKKPTYYELHRNERKKYQQTYRDYHLEEVRKKDRERKRMKSKGSPPVAQHIVVRTNIIVSFD
jgi:hypothetical protein